MSRRRVMLAEPERLPGDVAAALERVRPRLGPFGSRVLYFSIVGSTNDVASELAAAGGAHGTVVLADSQTAGRGRRGRSWFSPPGSGLYVSVVLEPSQASAARNQAMGLLTLAAGVAIAEGIEIASGVRVAIKWPNDLLVGRRKLGGILAEGVVATRSHAVSSVVLGYGVNVGSVAYPSELVARATSLEAELGRRADRAAVFAETLAALANRYRDLAAGRFDAILAAWAERAPASRGARVTWETPSGPQAGITAGVDERGALLVRVGSRVERLVAGEVTWL